MKRPSCHVRLLVLLCLMLVLTGGGLVAASGLAGASPLQPDSDAYERVVPGMTRAEDLAGIGIVQPQIVTARQAAARLSGRIDRTLDACLAADAWCTGYIFHQDAGDAVLLVMDGRVVFKGIAA